MPDNPVDLITQLSKVCPRGVPPYLERWLRVSTRARSFCQANLGKIQRKLRLARDAEVLQDAVAELGVAFLVYEHPDAVVDYELGGPEGPDLRVTILGQAPVHVEVRRVRDRETTVRFDAWRTRLQNAIRNIPGSVWVGESFRGMSFSVTLEDDRRDELERYVQVLEEGEVALHDWLRTEIPRIERQLVPDGPAICVLPECVLGQVEFEFTRSATPHPLPNCCPAGGTSPIPWDGREWMKFGGVVIEKLRQLEVGAPNVIAMVLDSLTHEADEVCVGLAQLHRAVTEAPAEWRARAGVEDPQEFEDRWSALTGVVAIPLRWRRVGGAHGRDANALWVNPSAAESLPLPVSDHLRRMESPS